MANNNLKIVILFLTVHQCLSVTINSLEKAANNQQFQRAKESLRNIGLKCKTRLATIYRDPHITPGGQFASMFMIATNTEPTNPIDLTCLNDMPRHLDDLSRQEEYARINDICKQTTRVIYIKKDGKNENPGTLEWNNNYFAMGRHTEQSLIAFIDPVYRKNMFRICHQMANPGVTDEAANTLYQQRGNLIGKPFNLYLYSHNSPCDTCLKRIAGDVTGRDPPLARAGIQNVMVFYNQLFRYSSPGLILNYPNDKNKKGETLSNKVHYWLTEAQIAELKKLAV